MYRLQIHRFASLTLALFVGLPVMAARSQDFSEPPRRGAVRDRLPQDDERPRDDQNLQEDREFPESRDREPARDRDPQRRDNDTRIREQGQPERMLVPPRDQHWRLGVYVQNTATGVRITQVVRGSAAWRAGLERDDVIVTVSGFQIGYVDGRLFELGPELQYRADRGGRVMLLVQNHRNGELVNLDVRLDRRDNWYSQRSDRR